MTVFSRLSRLVRLLHIFLSSQTMEYFLKVIYRKCNLIRRYSHEQLTRFIITKYITYIVELFVTEAKYIIHATISLTHTPMPKSRKKCGPDYFCCVAQNEHFNFYGRKSRSEKKINKWCESFERGYSPSIYSREVYLLVRFQTFQDFYDLVR